MGKHPVDAYRKSQRKRELKKNKHQQPKKKVDSRNDPDRVKAQIMKLNALGPNIDKGLKKKKKKLEKKYQLLTHQQLEQAGVSASMQKAILAHSRLEVENNQYEDESYYYPPDFYSSQSVATGITRLQSDPLYTQNSSLIDPEIDLSSVQLPSDPAPLPPLPPVLSHMIPHPI